MHAMRRRRRLRAKAASGSRHALVHAQVRGVDLLTLAQTVFINEEAASVWMNRPHMLLGGASPREAARKSEAGATRVREILDAIKYGGAV